jgi:hypothetical protein
VITHRWKTAVIAVGAAAAVTLVTVGGIAYAQGDNQLTVCKSKYTGLLRAINSTGKCSSWEEQITINRQGPAGPAGPAGQAGPAGPAGQAGAAGPAGSAVAKVRYVEMLSPAAYGSYSFTAACANDEYATSGGSTITPHNVNISVAIDQQGPAGPNAFAQNGDDSRGWRVEGSITLLRELPELEVPPVGLIKAYALCVKGTA